MNSVAPSLGAKSLKVLIAENHRDLCEVMSRIIDAEPDMRCVGQVAQVADVLPAAQQASADALVLDLSLQGGSSMQLIEELSQALPALRIVVFTGVAATDEVTQEVQRRGAAAFVTKGGDVSVLLNALRGEEALQPPPMS